MATNMESRPTAVLLALYCIKLYSNVWTALYCTEVFDAYCTSCMDQKAMYWTPLNTAVNALLFFLFPGTARRLGIVHCYNRPCELYYIPYKAPAAADPAAAAATAAAAAAAAAAGDSSGVTPVKVSGGVSSALSPVFSPDGSQLVLISQEAAVSSGVHAATSSLYALSWKGEVSKGCLSWLSLLYVRGHTVGGGADIKGIGVVMMLVSALGCMQQRHHAMP